MNSQLPIWTFGYKKPPAAATTAQVAASDEREAVLVAQKWCDENQARFFGSVRPFVVADPSILKAAPAEPEAIAAPQTTMDKLKNAVGL